ncbi:MAG: type I CRISPR-associated protein Cas7 [Syntrophaceticus schinkii]
MWELDRSAARGLMSCRGLYIFSHDNELGRAPAHKLFERLSVKRKEDVIVSRRFADYSISVEEEDFPEGVTLTTLSV